MFSEKKQFLIFNSIIPFSFPSGGCVVHVDDDGANHQGNQFDVHFLQRHIFTVMHFMNGEGVH